MRRGAWACFVLLFAGCSGVLGIEDLHRPTIKATLRDVASVGTVANAHIVLYRSDPPDFFTPIGNPIGEMMTAGDGMFELELPESSLPLDGYFEILPLQPPTDSSYLHTVSRLVHPLSTAVEHDDPVYIEDIYTLTASGLRMLAGDAGATQDEAGWMVIAEVVDAGGSTVAPDNVRVDPPSSVRAICYTNSNGPPCHANNTSNDDRAWLFVPEKSSLTITAVVNGNSHMVTVPLGTGPGVVFTPVPPPVRPPSW